MSEKTPSDKPAETKIRYFWFIDIFVVVFFLSMAIFSLYLFRADLMQTLESRDEEPVGTIVIRHNIVQRRYADRVLWDRLFVDSPVYSGDLIRAADLSEATIYIADNQIDLNENTLIRIQYSPGGRGPFEIELREGNLSLSSGAESSGLMLNLMGKQVQTGPGTVLNAAAGEEGIKIQVSEGAATFIEENNTRLLSEGTMVAQDAGGRELVIPGVVVKSPQPNARYLKNRQGPLSVNFAWNRINLGYGESLRLEIAGNPNFTRNFRAIEGLDSQAQMDFDAGVWYWRLAYGDAILSTGQLTVADASGPDLQSPVINSVFRYQNDNPQIRFQWSEKPGASYYILEVSETPDFVNPKIRRQVVAASYIQSELGQGIWYWRVLPVFSSAYEGSAVYSSLASFRIEQTSDTQAPTIEVPEPVLAATPVQTEPARSQPIPPTQSAQTVQSTQPTQPAQTVQSTQPNQSGQPVQSAQSVQPSQAVPPPAQASQQAQSVPSAQPTQQTQSAQPIPPVQSVQPARPVQAAAAGVAIIGMDYIVRSGDTLSRIAAQAYGIASRWPIIVAANSIPNPDLIYPEQVLFIPPEE